MPQRFEYIGPERLRSLATAGIARLRLEADTRAADILTALAIGDGAMDELTFTYIVDPTGAVWLADRHAEHVACARGGSVLAAGEITLDMSARKIAVLSATNQSTGYCPDPESWDALAQALDRVGIERPDAFDHAFVFGRCRACRAIAIIKEDETCFECGGSLGPVRGT